MKLALKMEEINVITLKIGVTSSSLITLEKNTTSSFELITMGILPLVVRERVVWT